MFLRAQTDLVVELAVDRLAVSINQFEGVRAIAVHVTVAIGQTTIAEQERHLQEMWAGCGGGKNRKYTIMTDLLKLFCTQVRAQCRNFKLFPL